MNNRGKIDIVQRADSTLAITIDTNNSGDVWVTRHEIADLFQIFVSAVSSNLKVIFKSNELFEDEVTRGVAGVTFYNLDVVIALAFRCKGPICVRFRQWLRDKAKKPMISERQPLIIHIGKSPFFS